ncbi:MAG: metal-dependent hydrolase [Anaerolineae bacterium]|nr:metal-dependent hydrolase [Anaerolineae bacterium]
MQTYSHYIITAVLGRVVKKQQGRSGVGRWPPLRHTSLLLGSVAPDVPLIAITLGLLLADVAGVKMVDGSGQVVSSNVAYLFETMFFHDPWVKAAHNLFHAPLLVVGYTALGYWAWKTERGWGPALFWFGLACTLHTAIDIPLHYDDGPLLFFPFDWQTRFHSPVSYWDPARYGRPFAIFEHLLVLGMVIYLIVDWWRNRRALSAETVG